MPQEHRDGFDFVEKLDNATHKLHRSVDTLGSMGAFGLTGSVLTRRSPVTARKMQLIQEVYDNFGHQATANIIGAEAVHGVVRRLPEKLKHPLVGGARALVKNKPLINKVVSFAGQIARAV